MRGAAIVALFLLLQAAPPMPRKAGDNSSKSSNAHQDKTAPDKTQSNPGIIAKPPTSEKDQKPSQKLTGQDENKPVIVRVVPVDVNKNWADYLYIGASLLIALATLVLARIAWTQANAAQASAEAAKAQADAIITGDRPWLLIPPDGIQEPYLVPVEENMGNRMAHCIFSTKNYGKTPGKIFASKAELQIGDSPGIPPDPSVYEMNKAEHTVITFPPGESVASEALLAPLAFIKAQDRNEVLHGGKYLWLCGFLKYRDTFERDNAPEHETRFCYLYENRFNTPKPFWKIAGLSIYTRAT